MKLFISADIEGTTGIAHWNETEKNHPLKEKSGDFRVKSEDVDDLQSPLFNLFVIA